MLERFTPDELQTCVSNFENNKKEPFITNSALISLEDLEKFVDTIKKQKADSIRIYFIRFGKADVPKAENIVDGKVAEGCVWLTTPKGFTQVSVAIVPAKKFRRDKNYIFSAEDIIRNKKITTLMPGVEKEGTALNPPPSVTKSKGK